MAKKFSYRFNGTSFTGQKYTYMGPSTNPCSRVSSPSSITVKDSLGWATSENNTYVYNFPSISFLGLPLSGCAPLLVDFTGSSLVAIDSWDWDFGDESSSQEQSPSHEFASSGRYTISLTGTNASGTKTITETDYITVRTTPVTNFSASPLTGEPPLTVNFTDLSTGYPTSWNWNFGDDITSIEENPDHQYINEGSYTITLYTSNECGNDTEVKTAYISVTTSGSGRGIFAGGMGQTYPGNYGTKRDIQYITISTLGNASLFGNLAGPMAFHAGCSSNTRGVFMGGYYTSNSSLIQYITIASLGDSSNYGNLLMAAGFVSGVSNNTRGICHCGDLNNRRLEYITISTVSNSSIFGDVTTCQNERASACGSPTRALILSGYCEVDGSGGTTRTTSYVEIATLGNTTYFGELIHYSSGISSCSSNTRAVIMRCGSTANLGYFTISTLGNSETFGNYPSYCSASGTSNSIRGIFFGGDAFQSSLSNVINYVTIATTSNAADFGDLKYYIRNGASCSDSHGGLA